MADDLWPTVKGLFRRAWPRFKKIYWRWSVLSVFILVGLWNTLISWDAAGKLSRGKGLWPETLADLREVNTHLQLRFYQILSSWRPVPFEPHRVVLVYIDDVAHWTTLWGNDPTPRDYLATLITNASQPKTKADVIALDVELFTPGINSAGDDDRDREKQNDKLLKAIHDAAVQNVHIVLPTAFFEENGQRVRVPNIFKDTDLPLKQTDGKCGDARACVSFGFINPPDDRRQIPLRQSMLDWDKSTSLTFDSFAFAIVNAAEEHHQTTLESLAFATVNTAEEQRKSTGSRLVEHALKTGEPLLGSFVEERNFDRIPIEKLYKGDPDALNKCNASIVLIGGRWHTDDGHGLSYVDSHFSPAGEISGLAFHANYVESLLCPEALSREVGPRAAIVLDLLIGMLIYAGFDSEKQWQRVLMLIGAFAIAPLVAYLALISRNAYLDFLLPAELYFLHVLYEYVHSTRDRRVAERAPL